MKTLVRKLLRAIGRPRQTLSRLTAALERRAGPSVRPTLPMPEREFLRTFRSGSDNAPFDATREPSRTDLLGHFGRRIAAGDWPGVPDTLTDLRLDLSRLADEEIVARADRALEGDVHHSGIAYERRDDGGIAWEINPADTREWLLMLHRHGWWPLLGAAYERSGDEKYSRAFVRQMLDWIERNPMPAHKSEHLASWRLMETGLRMRVSWLSSFGCFFGSEAFTDDAKLAMLRSIHDHGAFLHMFFTNRNHLLRESNGLLALGLAIPEFASAEAWVLAATDRLARELEEQVNEDGTHLEMSSGYQWLTAIEFDITWQLLERHGRRDVLPGLGDRLRDMYQFLAAVLRPDRTFPQLNDGFIIWDAAHLASIGRKRGWPEIEFAATAGESGSKPSWCSRSFPNAGFHVMRSDWGREARYLVADTGPFGGPHGHEDKLSFELSACGENFIVDPGSYTYNPDDAFRPYFVGSAGHNAVLVDGGSQVRRWRPEHMVPAVEPGSHGRWHADERIEVAVGRYREGFAPYAMSRPDGVSLTEDVIHDRAFIFVRAEYWVIIDRLDAGGSHDFEFLFHLAPHSTVERLTESGALVGSRDNGPRLLVEGLGSDEMSSEVITGDHDPIQGWYSPEHYVKQPSPALAFRTRGNPGLDLAWVLYPFRAGKRDHHVQASMQTDGELTMLKVELRDRTDTLRLRWHEPTAGPDSNSDGTPQLAVELDRTP